MVIIPVRRRRSQRHQKFSRDEDLTKSIVDCYMLKFCKVPRLDIHMDPTEASKDIIDQFDIEITVQQAVEYIAD